MTCLYCGKKLGFFSRYKDTPFCSEEHLRVHQDELERALMERLGSKSVTPARSLRSLDSLVNEAPPLKSMVRPEAAARSLEPATTAKESPKDSKQASDPQPRESKPKELKVAAPLPPEPVATPSAPPPPPLYEDYIIEMPSSRPALDARQPLIPPSSFAIIVQADCCTPSSPDPDLNLAFPLDTTEFEIDTSSLLRNCTFAAPELPAAYGEDGFGQDWSRLPVSVSSEPDSDFALFGDIVPLEYDATSSLLQYNALGRRDELTPRIRLRFPYAASEVSSVWNELPFTDQSYPLSACSDWDPILPSASGQPRIQEPQATQPELTPPHKVKLSIQALANFTLDYAEQQDSSDSLVVLALSLSDSSGLSIDCASSSWAAKTMLPGPSTSWQARSNWQPVRSSDRVPPIPFPSLFQLGPVLPPRPESSAG